MNTISYASTRMLDLSTPAQWFTPGYGDTVHNRDKKFIDTLSDTIRGIEALFLFVEG